MTRQRQAELWAFVGAGVTTAGFLGLLAWAAGAILGWW